MEIIISVLYDVEVKTANNFFLRNTMHGSDGKNTGYTNTSRIQIFRQKKKILKPPHLKTSQFSNRFIRKIRLSLVVSSSSLVAVLVFSSWEISTALEHLRGTFQQNNKNHW